MQNVQESQNSTPYSYHTFVYTFRYSNHGSVSMEQMKRIVERKKYRKKNLWVEDKPALPVEEGKDAVPANLLEYSVFQYFDYGARKALFIDAQSSIAFNYKCSCVTNTDNHLNSTYRITFTEKKKTEGDEDAKDNKDTKDTKDNKGAKGTKDEKKTIEKTINLKLNAIRLKIFNTGIAVICYECEYHPENANEINKYRSEVMLINEYGRRLYPEYISENSETGEIPCAEKLSIRVGKRTLAEENFRDNVINDVYLEKPVKLPQIITGLLLENDKNEIELEPVMDSRMFVCCCIVDGDYTKKLKAHRDSISGEWKRYCQNEEASKKLEELDRKKLEELDRQSVETAQELYALVNIDRSVGYCSCQDWKMLCEELDKQIYTRWIDYDTLYGVTNYSMVCVTNDNHTVDAFLTEYILLCVLSLAQRATLIDFDARISHLIATAHGKKKHIEKKMQSQLIELEEDYSIFEGQLLLPEPTHQIQGIELYAMIQERLFIEKLREKVQREIANLYEIAEFNQGEAFNFWGATFALIALAISVMQSREKYETDWLMLCTALGICALGALIALFFWWKRRSVLSRKHKRN